MNKIIPSIFMIVSMIFISGCESEGSTVSVSKHPNAEEILSLDENANIFQWDGIIYQSDIDWVDELRLEKKDYIGETTYLFSTENAVDFKNGMATSLPIGTHIYSTNEADIVMVESKGEEKYFLALREG